METVLVIGGGITGLTTLFELEKLLKQKQKKMRLILAEAENRVGGKIRTVKNRGFIMETGADSIVHRKMEDITLLSELGLENEVVYNATGTSFLYTDGELKEIPHDSVFGIPAGIESLAKTTLVSAEGKVEALRDFYLHDRMFSENDSVGEFLEYYLGKEFVEKQIAPVLSGVYSGSIYDLTIGTTLPYLLRYKEEYGSIIKGLEANKDHFLGNSGKKFLSFKEGLSAITDTLAEKLEQTEILLNKKAVRIEKDARFRVYFEDGHTVDADYIVLAVPHLQAKKLFTDAELQTCFDELKSGSIISVYMGFEVPDDVLPANGTGFLNAGDKMLDCGACTWTSRKWEHTSRDGNLLVRLFYKRNHPRFAQFMEMDDEDLVSTAISDIEKTLGIKEKPSVYDVTKWDRQMPVYQLNHRETVGKLEAHLENHYCGIYLAGASYYGAGIPDCIENGYHTARKIINGANA